MEEGKVEAREKYVLGWNIRCNLCGTYGAEWIRGERPGWGALALCPAHKAELLRERYRHGKEMKRLRTINFEQRNEKQRKEKLESGRIVRDVR